LPIDESENVAEGDLSDADETTDDALMMEHLLEIELYFIVLRMILQIKHLKIK
jgi:hypothetical protein